jgi:subtilisin family serine protease
MRLPGGTGSRAVPGMLQRLGLTGLAVATAVALGSGPATAAPADGTIHDAGSADGINDSFIVMLKPSGIEVNQSATNLASQYGGSVTYTYRSAMRGFAVSMSEARARQLAGHPSVSGVWRNLKHTIQAQANPPSWGLDRIDQRDLPLDKNYNVASDGAGVSAYVVDTGIRTTHTDFGARAKHGRDTVDNDSDATDCHGHGTHVAGTLGGNAYGVAKGVTIYAVRALDCNGNGTTAQVVAAIDWVAANAIRPAVANVSLGGEMDPVLDQAIERAIAQGITFAVAAGNGDTLGNPLDACTNSPARVADAITVAAANSIDVRAPWSNFGTCVDLFAPGTNITSAWASSNTASSTISGTSMASPHVAGAAALYLAAHPNATPAQVHAALVDAATSNKVTDPKGSPNKLLYIDPVAPPRPEPPPPPPTNCTGSNDTDLAIPEYFGSATSRITISGCDRTASSAATVEVNITHPYRGDLVIDLLAPDGTVYNLKTQDIDDDAPYSTTTHTVNLSTEQATGLWRLRVRDMYFGDTGFINAWSLTI